MTKYKANQDRGSILLMTVGMLTILAMIGSVFLIVSHLDAKRAESVAVQSHVNPIPGGVLTQLQEILAADLYIDGTDELPYSDTDGGSAGWKQYVDAPSHNPAGGQPEIDEWLANTWYSAGAWAHITNISGEDPADVSDIAVGDPSLGDTDGDGIKDAIFYDADVMDAYGRKYWVAVRVTDLAALLNVNTAAFVDAGNMPPYIAPVDIDLKGFLGDSVYNDLHVERCGSGSQVISDFHKDSALRILSPAVGYLPFDAGDEMHLRNLAGGATDVGRLFDATKTGETPLGAGVRRWLTTASIGRARVRHPEAGFTSLLTLHDPDDATASLATAAHRTRVYNRTVRMLEDLDVGTPGPDCQKMATCFVANLWAYQSDGAGAPWAFECPDDSNLTAYGLAPQIVITEAYAAHKLESVPLADDHIYAYAIEVWNPTDSPIDFDYKLFESGVEVAAGTNTIGTNSRIVLYDGGKGANCDETAVGWAAGDFTTPPAGWVKVPGLDFSGGKTYTLVQVVSGVDVPVDQVTSGDLGYVCNNKTTDPDEFADIRRDDDEGAADNDKRQRYNVAAYAATSGGALAAVTQNLGDANDLTTAEKTALDTGTGAAPYSVPIQYPAGGISSLGELGLIYLTGPMDESGTLSAFPQNVADIDETERVRGRLDFHPSLVPLGGHGGGDYPDVPVATLLGEFFTIVPPDATRSDDPTRLYGKVNVNTATAEVLERLPFPASFTLTDKSGAAVVCDVDPADAAEFILAYRDKRQVAVTGSVRDYLVGSRSGDDGAHITNLRSDADSNIRGYLAAGELAIPLADYANELMGWADYNLAEITNVTSGGNYAEARDAMYRAVGNLVRVNSDVYAVNMLVQLEPVGATSRAQYKYRWRYVAVIDRSGCVTTADRPAILLFGQVK